MRLSRSQIAGRDADDYLVAELRDVYVSVHSFRGDLPLLIVWGDCDPIIPVGHGRRAAHAIHDWLAQRAGP